MFKLLIQLIWFFLPAIFANMSPVIFQKVSFLDYPLDFNLQLKNKPLLGKNKTYRGLFFGILIAILVIIIQKELYSYMLNFSVINYNQINIYLLGFLLGFGALSGDALKSFFKRRLNIPSGKPWIPFDQIDWFLGALLLTGFYVHFSLKEIIISIIISILLHPLINLISYSLGLQKNKI
jgi:CDP-2,3-bis-(O-geranylgeranyl)-sn-glycerol synthase